MLLLNHEYAMRSSPDRQFALDCSGKNSKQYITGTCQFQGFLETLSDCQWRGLPHQRMLSVNNKVNWNTNMWKQKTAAPGPDFLVRFILYWIAFDLRKNGRFRAVYLLICANSIQETVGIYHLLSHYHWNSSVKRNRAHVETLVNFDGFPEEMQCKIGKRICCSHI